MKKQVLHTKSDLDHWFLWKQGKFAFDTETTSLRYTEMDIVGMSFCDGQEACYIDLWQNPEKEAILERLKEIFDLNIKKLIMHSAKFDLKVLHKLGFNFVTNNIFCTQTAAHLLDEVGQNGLKYLAKTVLKVSGVLNYDDVKDNYKSQKFYDYAINDAIWTWQLHEVYDKELRWQALDKLFFGIEMPFQFVLRDLEINGVLVDVDKMKVLDKQLEEMIFDWKIKLLTFADLKYGIQYNLLDGKADVISANLNSSTQLVEIIQDRLGLKITEITKGGKPSAGVKSLQKLKGKHEFIDLLLQFKKAVKMHDSFTSTFPSFVESDGRIRTSFNNCVATTGRLSSSNPNLQQLPKKKSDFPIDFRSCFIAPKGKKLIVIDFSGQELRVCGHVSQDKKMIEAFNKKVDLHLLFANKLFNLGLPKWCLKETDRDYENIKEQYGEKRDIAKNKVAFPLIYGSTAYGIAASNSISEELAQSYIDEFFDLYPDVKKTVDKCIRQVRNQGYVRNGAGRKRRFKEIKAKAFRQAFNFLIQGYCADLLRVASVKVREFIEVPSNVNADLKFLLLIHDELVLECDENEIGWVVPSLKRIIEDSVELTVKLPVEIGVGRNYSEAK
jgi:DNA polymerase-1